MSERDQKPSTALREEELSLQRSGRSLPVFRVYPDDNKAHPAIILVHEIFGLNEHIKDVARRLARESYTVYAPELFDVSTDYPINRNDLSQMREVWGSISDEQILGDLQAVFASARQSPQVIATAIGSMGFCMGGAIAYMFACRNPLLAYVVDFYGRIYYQEITENKARHPIAYTGGLNCPMLGLFSGIDPLIPEEQINILKTKLSDLGKTYQLKVYPRAKHAFFNDTRELYDHESANDAWQLTLAFIEANSKKSS
ncbi:MAG: dienelactone hydrolase family protein [Candidatus Obscuribacterales bacterium]|nr:dienelactone hydrolase family protein [Candidatus Obscuribacterales bacterium]